jgi:hypothetical protein
MAMVRKLFVASLAHLVLVSSAYAGQLAGGPIFGGPTQGSATCYVFNFGTPPVTIGSFGILDQNGNSTTLSANLCGTSLANGTGCAFSALIGNGLAYSCYLDVSKVASLRGSMDIRNSAGTVLANTPLR